MFRRLAGWLMSLTPFGYGVIDRRGSRDDVLLNKQPEAR